MTAQGKTRILVVSAEGRNVDTLSSLLEQEETFEILSAGGMAEGLTLAQVEWPSLIALNLPQEEMLEVCGTLKEDQGTKAILIIMINADDDLGARIAGFEAGVDDYVSGARNPREIVLRIKAVLRRGNRAMIQEQFVRGPIRLDPARCDVAVDNKRVHLTAVEFKLLRSLVIQPGEVKTREALQAEAHSGVDLVETRTIDTHIRRLRKKLGQAAHLVETVRGAGYRLRPT